MSEGSTKPLTVGTKATLTAVRLNDDGDGVGQLSGMTVFIPQLLPGETANVRVTEVKNRYARAVVELRHSDADIRIAPLCQVHEDCGGCQLQHVDYPAQLLHKQAMVRFALRHLPQAQAVDVRATLGMAHPYRYRNQIQVPVQFDATEHRMLFGFYASASHRIVETSVCQLEPMEMEESVRAVVARLENSALAPFVKHVIVRRSHTDGQQMIVLSVRHSFRQSGVSIPDLLCGLRHVVSIAVTIHHAGNNNRLHGDATGSVWGDETIVLWGATHLHERLADLDFLISPRSFFQVNTAQAANLCAQVIEMAQVGPNDSVLDAYCGAGTLSLPLAHRMAAAGGHGRVMGIERVEAAILDARVNATHNGIDNAVYEVGLVEDVLPQMIKQGNSFDVVVLDPPRKGCHPSVLAAVLRSKPKRIVYISCNHVTLGRDLHVLVAGGYMVDVAQPIDMFPQTGHVECVVSLVRKD